MLRTLQIFCAVICVSTGVVFALCVLDFGREDREVEQFCRQPGIVERFNALRGRRENDAGQSSPLVAQAQVFAAYLAGPSQDKTVPVARKAPPPVVPSLPAVAKVRPVPSAKFTLEGTSYYPNEPARSMALVSEPGSPEGNERWVKEGTRVGHFVIDKIKHSAIVYRDAGGQLHEMSVEHRPAGQRLVRNHIPSRNVVAQAASDRPSAAGSEMDSNSVDR